MPKGGARKATRPDDLRRTNHAGPGSGRMVRIVELSADAAKEARQKCRHLYGKTDKATVSEYVSRLVLDADNDVYTAMLATVQADSE